MAIRSLFLASRKQTLFSRFRHLAGSMSLIVALFVVALSQIAAAQSVAQSYSTSGTVQTGMIVMLAGKSTTTVTAATTADASKIFGVIINPADATETLSSSATGQLVYVATAGTYDMLVSNQNGPIETGDYLTISSLDGVGMKAGSSESTIIGKAQSGFDGKTNVISTSNLTSSTGSKVAVSVGEVPVAIAPGHNPMEVQKAPNVPPFLEHIMQDVTHKQVDAARAYLSLSVLVITFIIIGIMLYSGVRSSIVAIGRNPLSKQSILTGLLEVGFTSLLIFIAGVFAVYLLLRL